MQVVRTVSTEHETPSRWKLRMTLRENVVDVAFYYGWMMASSNMTQPRRMDRHCPAEKWFCRGRDEENEVGSILDLITENSQPRGSCKASRSLLPQSRVSTLLSLFLSLRFSFKQ